MPRHACFPHLLAPDSHGQIRSVHREEEHRNADTGVPNTASVDPGTDRERKAPTERVAQEVALLDGFGEAVRIGIKSISHAPRNHDVERDANQAQADVGNDPVQAVEGAQAVHEEATTTPEGNGKVGPGAMLRLRKPPLRRARRRKACRRRSRRKRCRRSCQSAEQ